MADASKKGALAPTAPGGAIATYDYGQDAGAGFEGVKGSDLSIPFISVLQSISPQVEDKLVDGAVAGMLFNTVTKELIDGEKGMPFLPVHIDNTYVWWGKDRGGFKGMFDPSSEEVKAAIKANGDKTFGKLKHGEDELVQTFYAYGLNLDEAGAEAQGFSVLSFSSTKIKAYKDWTTAMFMIKGKPPLFANRAIVRTVKQKNDKGSFFNFKIDPLKSTWAGSLVNPATDGDLLVAAKKFREMVTSGKARAAFETQNAASGKGGEAGTGGDAPF